ncbi:MAG: copper chaperone PCu(A)C [Campylobacter sp.]|uniref:copper chaperone PCu(A)C n=1 Tax=Campylobacter sp. TaxID=205 RepID=UPI001B65348C|nr:copper chaperone PCu(A)C [Campylobacter sp.]MBP3675492.1 copper chaperone PCu(A)C [Campylobacter sp.]
MFKYFSLVAVAAFALQAEVLLVDPYAKATPPNAKNSAAFMKIENKSSNDIELLSASSNISKVTEIHTHIEENGMKKMIQIPSIKIPANSSVELKPGGLHIMFLGIQNQINENSNIDLNLTFSNGKTYELNQIPVKKVIPAKMH